MLYNKRVESTEQLFEVIEALEVLEKKYTIRKETETYEGAATMHPALRVGSVWYIEEVEK